MTNPDREELVKLADLRSANVARQKEWDAGNQITLAYRGNELAGEVGEACNVIKKLERERLGIAGSRDTVAHLAEELADVVICADLIAMHEGIDLLGEAVPAKFNATSEKVGLKTRLASSDGGVKGEPLAWLRPGPDGDAFAICDEDADGAFAVFATAPPVDAGMRSTTKNILECISTELSVMAESWTGAFSGLKDGDDVAEYLTGAVWANLAEAIDALTAPCATTKSDGGVCAGGINPGWDECPECGATSDEECKFSKSDVEALAATTAERPGTVTSEPEPSTSDPLAGKVPCHCHDAVSVRLCLDRDRCYTVEAQPIHAIKMPEYRYQEPDPRGGNVSFGNYGEYTPVTVRGSTSDPSSARSEVTVEELAKAIYYADPFPDLDGPLRWEHLNRLIKDKHLRRARALLDQFEIRRKK